MRIGVLIDRPLSTLLALKGRGIERLSDLRGKRIGYGSGEVERVMVGAMLRHAGVAIGDVDMVQIGEQLTVALLSGQVDAVSVYRNFEPLELQQRGVPSIGFDYEANGIPDFDDLILVARADSKTDPRLARFLRATARGLAYLHAHPAESWQLVRTAYPDLDDTLNHAAWNTTLHYFASDPAALDRARYDRFERFLYDEKLIPAMAPAWSYCVTLSGAGGRAASILP
jgi:putative hydroxymethylpyrimidine transport system substrate-binding protein